ncbi:MAG: response regulator [Deltaproteobacteria bacterium]|nr:response regulator [Deltaproteobacteria bacterium]
MERTRILVIDDEAAMTRMLRRNLERTGRFEVREENHARRAVDTALAFQPELVVLDVLMPEMDGTQVAAEFRQRAELSRVPVLFLSALVPTGDFSTAEAPPGLFFVKPVEVDVLIEAIDHVVAASRAEATHGGEAVTGPSTWR